MSQPTFPANPEITRDDALNMILASIAMEELGLSHIINAEGEKLQYILEMFTCCDDIDVSVDKILEVNNSITRLLDSVMQNQICLKGEMDKVLDCPQSQPGPSKKNCMAIFSGICECLKSGDYFKWRSEHAAGKCISHDFCDCSKIILAPKKCFQLSFSANICGSYCADCKCSLSLKIETICCNCITDVFTYSMPMILDNIIPVTASFGGIFVSTRDCAEPAILTVELISPHKAAIKQAFLSIMEI